MQAAAVAASLALAAAGQQQARAEFSEFRMPPTVPLLLATLALVGCTRVTYLDVTDAHYRPDPAFGGRRAAFAPYPPPYAPPPTILVEPAAVLVVPAPAPPIAPPAVIVPLGITPPPMAHPRIEVMPLPPVAQPPTLRR